MNCACEIVLSILNAYASLKKKHLRVNHFTFVIQKLWEAVKKRARLRNAYFKETEGTKAIYPLPITSKLAVSTGKWYSRYC